MVFQLPWFALGLLLGNLLGLYTPLAGIQAAPPLLAAAALASLALPILRPLVALSVGAAVTCLQVQSVTASKLDRSLEGKDLEITGQIISLVSHRPGRVSFMFEPRIGATALPQRIRLSWYQPDGNPRGGETWRLGVRLRPPRGQLNPGGFDYEKWLFRNRVGAVGYVRWAEPLPKDSGSRERPVLEVRERFRQWLGSRLPDGRARGLILALTIGARDGLSPEDRKVLAATGTAHLVAISGLHIGLVAGAIFYLAQFACRLIVGFTWIQRQVICWALVLPVTSAYAALAGFGLPARRALIMLAVLACWQSLRWPRRPAAPLSVALALVLAADPLAALGWDFWLSFGAVSCISLVMAGRRAPAIPNRALWWRVQLGISIGLAPFLVAGFGQVSLVSPLVNALLVPWFGITVMPPLLLAVASWPCLPGFASAILAMEAWQLDLIWSGLEALAQYGGAGLYPGSVLALCAALLGSLLLLAPAGLPGRWLGSLLWLAAICPMRAQLPEGGMELVVLDVGQGLSTVIHTRGHAMVYDAGPSYPGGDAGRDVVIPYLRSRASGLDLLVISHSDLDHAGGRRSIVGEFETLRELAGDGLTGARPCIAGQRWSWDGVQFTILHPLPATKARGNAASCVLLVRGKYGSVLLTGDIEISGEETLLQAWPCLEVEVVVAPHHGSKSSSGSALVDATRPEWIVFAAGYRNRWDFPAAEVVARWRASGARVLVTGEMGAIRMRFSDPGAMRPRLQRVVEAAPWRAAAVSRDINVQYHARYSRRGRETSPCSKSSDLAGG